MPTSNADTVRAAFEAYLAQDRAAAERLIAANVVFTSPQDDHIDKTAYMKRCFPTADRLRSQQILELVDTDDDGVSILYEYELTTGERHRNAEFITVHSGNIVDIQVFSGGGCTGGTLRGGKLRFARASGLYTAQRLQQPMVP